MKTVSISEAKANFSQLLREAARGKCIVITKRGKPFAKLTALGVPEKKRQRRLGFMKDIKAISIPDDFDRMAQDEICAMFGTELEPSRST